MGVRDRDLHLQLSGHFENKFVLLPTVEILIQGDPSWPPSLGKNPP